MKIKSLLSAGVFLFAAVFCLAESTVSNPTFPQVGNRYEIEFVPVLSAEQVGGSLHNRDRVTILARGEQGWCLVEHLIQMRFDEKSKKQVYRKEQFWLNFGVLLAAREVGPALAGQYILEQ